MLLRRCCALALAAAASAYAPQKPLRRPTRLRAAADVAARLEESTFVLNFACFGFYERDCLLKLDADGLVEFSAGMVSEGPGEWRVVPGDPEDQRSTLLASTIPKGTIMCKSCGLPPAFLSYMASPCQPQREMQRPTLASSRCCSDRTTAVEGTSVGRWTSPEASARNAAAAAAGGRHLDGW